MIFFNVFLFFGGGRDLLSRFFLFFFIFHSFFLLALLFIFERCFLILSIFSPFFFLLAFLFIFLLGGRAGPRDAGRSVAPTNLVKLIWRPKWSQTQPFSEDMTQHRFEHLFWPTQMRGKTLVPKQQRKPSLGKRVNDTKPRGDHHMSTHLPKEPDCEVCRMTKKTTRQIEKQTSEPRR